MRKRHVQILVGLLFAPSFGSFAQNTAPPPASTAPATAKLKLSIPKAISQADLEQYSAILVLSEPQLSFAQSRQAQYVDEYDGICVKEMPSLTESAQIAGGHFQQNDWESALAASSETRKMENELRKRLSSLDNRFFDELIPVLGDEQLQKLDSVKGLRRRQCVVSYGVSIPSAMVDLTTMLRHLGLWDEDNRNLATVVSQYEKELTPAVLALDRRIRETYDDLNGIKIALRTNAGDKAALDQKKHSLLSGRDHLQRQILKINERYLQTIAAELNEDDRRVLVSRYNATVQPFVYPDENDPEELYVLVRNLLAHQQDVQTAVDEIWKSYRQTYSSLCDKMSSQYVEWCSEIGTNAGKMTKDEYRAAMTGYRDARFELHEQFLKQMKSLLPPDTLALVEKKIETALEGIDSARTEAAGQPFPPY